METSVRRVAGWTLAVLVLFGAGEQAAAQQRGGGGGGRGGGAPMTPLAYRQGIMQQLQQNLGALTAVRNGTVGAPTHVVARAIVIQQLSAMLPAAFPANSGGEGSRSLPAVWENPTELNARIRAMRPAEARWSTSRAQR